VILAKGGEMYRMFGNASTLIGAGMLIGGAALELVDKYESIAGVTLTLGGAVILTIAGWRYVNGGWSSRFVLGSILLMGLAVHLGGIELLCQEHQTGSPLRNLVYIYYALALAAVGWVVDVRLVTALAIVPFAQALETGTSYFHAAYVFYSPESTLSIVQLAVLIAACLWLAARRPERDARHLRILMMLGFVAANLCALVGSLWGDVIGETIWGPGRYWSSSTFETWEAFDAARTAFRESALQISAGVYSILWAAVLVVMVLWAAQRHQRGLFNGALTFGGIHAYTQMFETFGDEPLAYVIGAVADATEILSHVDFEDELTPEEEQVMSMVHAVVAGIAENTMSKTFVSGIDDFMNAVEDPERYLDGYLKKQAGAFIPYSALRRDIAKIQDPLIREAWTLADKLRKDSGIPGVAEALPLSLDIYGNPREYRGGAILGPLSPFTDSAEQDDALAHDMAALMDETRRVPITMPGRQIDGLRLSASEYHEYVNLSRNIVQLGGKDFDTYVMDLMGSTAYERMGPDGKVDMIKDAQRQFDAAARQELIKLYDTGEADSLAARLRRRDEVQQERKFGDFLN